MTLPMLNLADGKPETLRCVGRQAQEVDYRERE